MQIDDFVKSFGVTLYYFDKDLWQRPGIYIEDIKTIFVNNKLSDEAIKRVVYHELGHLSHNPNLYKNNHTKCENEANRIMIHQLIEEELKSSDDQQSFNYLNFMKKHKLKTITDEIMVIDEYYSLIS